MPVPRAKEIRRRRKRRATIAKLRLRYQRAKGSQEKARILEKLGRVSPKAKLD
jgi:hypothetical protein